MEKIIQSNHENFFMEALKTFPVEPDEFNITFNAHNISCTLEKDKEKAEEEYISICRRNKIIPYSLLELESTEDGAFEPSISPIQGLSHDRRGKTIEEIVQGILRRDKIYRIIFKQEHGLGGLEKLKSDYLWNLEKDGYNLSAGQTFFGDWDPRPYGSVHFTKWHEKAIPHIRIRFEQGDALTDELLSLISWANKLSSKFT